MKNIKNSKRFRETITAIFVAAIIMSSLVLLAGCSSDEAADGRRAAELYGASRDAVDYAAYSWSDDGSGDAHFDSADDMAELALPAADQATARMAAPAPAAAMPMATPMTGGDHDAPGESVAPLLPVAGAAFAERIIHTAGAIIETMEFDDTIDRIHAMLALNGGFIEHADIGGRPMDRGQPVFDNPNRRAEFTLRIPQINMNAVTNSVNELGNVLSLRRSAVNVTTQFIDTESRVTALRIQEERLLYMLGEAARIPDMLEIERRVSDVRFEIERLTSSLMNLQNQVNFSTISLSIIEVEEYTAPPEPEEEEIEEEYEEEEELTYWQQVREGFGESARAVGGFFTGIFRWLAVNSPILAIIAVFAIPAVIIIRRKIAKIRETMKSKQSASLAENEDA